MTVALTYIIYIPFPYTHLSTNHHGSTHTHTHTHTQLPYSKTFHFTLRHRSHDFRDRAYYLKLHVLLLNVLRWRTAVGRSTARLKMKKFISTTNLDGGNAHFGLPYSSSLPITTGATHIHTLWTSPVPTTNLHVTTTNTHSLDTPLPIPISTGDTLIHSFGHPYSLYQSPRGPHYYTLFFGNPHPSTYLHGGNYYTLFLDTPTPIYTNQLWSLSHFRLFV